VLALLEHLRAKRSRERLVRCFLREDGKVRYVNFPEADVPFDEVRHADLGRVRSTGISRSRHAEPDAACGTTGAGTS